MKCEKNNGIFNIISSKGNLEIINKILNSQKPIQFKEFKLITNPITKKKYSTRTISNKLKILEENGLIETKFIENIKRKTFGYRLTEKGIQAINIIKEAEEKYKKIN